MPDSPQLETREERKHRLAFRDAYAVTGTETLKALLIVSGGGAVAYLAFLNAAMAKDGLLKDLLPQLAPGFLEAMYLYIISVALCILCYGFTWVGHSAYYLKFDRLGHAAMAIAVLMGIGCLSAFTCGSLKAVDALRDAATAMGKPSTS